MWPDSRRTSLAVALAAAAIFAAPTACKRERAPGGGALTQPVATGRTASGAKLPAPHPLPADPVFAAHVASPSELLKRLRPFAPELMTEREIAAEILANLGHSELEAAIVRSLDFAQPVTVARVASEIIVALPVMPDAAQTLGPQLDTLASEGRFGAKRLPERPQDEGPQLIWHDEASNHLVFAGTPAGLSTSRGLAKAYGRAPVFATAANSLGELLGEDLPFSRLTLQGTGPRSFELRAQGVNADALPELASLSDGALTGLLEAPQVAWGISGRYAHYQDTVAQITSELTAQVRDQNFLVRGILEDLLRRFNAVIRSWNGRVAFAAGPANHILVGMGTDDPARAERAVLHFIGGVLDNLKLASTFGLDVPKIRFQKGAARVGDLRLHELTVRGVAGQVDASAHALFAGSDLKAALAFPPAGGAALLVVGPDARAVASTWVTGIENRTAPADSLGDMLAASFAVSPEALRPVLEGQDPLGGISLSADAPPTYAIVRREGSDYVLRVGPKTR